MRQARRITRKLIAAMDAPFDRGEIDRASLDATERLRARLSSPPPAAVQSRSGVAFAWVLAAGLFVFAAGLLANPWFETTIRSNLPFAAPPPPPVMALPATPALEARLAQMERQLAETRGSPTARMPAERLARTEAKVENSTDQIARESNRIDRLSTQLAGLIERHDADRARSDSATAAALTAANRAESMLTLLLARRAIESGRALGALDTALRRGFEARYPDAVKAVAALGAAPVTLPALRRDFKRFGPAIGAPTAIAVRQSWWEVLTGSLSSAVSKPPGNNAAPPERAAKALARGDVTTAASQLRRLPAPRDAAVSAWLDSVDRWRAGVQGLAILETASLLGPPEPIAVVAAVPPATSR
jgi:hypothetical protein